MTDDEQKQERDREPTPIQLTVRIPWRIHRKFKVLAALERRSMTDLILDWISDYVRRSDVERPVDWKEEPGQSVEDLHSRGEKIEMLIELRKEGRSLEEIARELNERGVLNFRGRPKWQKGQVYRFFESFKPQRNPEEASEEPKKKYAQAMMFPRTDTEEDE